MYLNNNIVQVDRHSGCNRRISIKCAQKTGGGGGGGGGRDGGRGERELENFRFNPNLSYYWSLLSYRLVVDFLNFFNYKASFTYIICFKCMSALINKRTKRRTTVSM